MNNIAVINRDVLDQLQTIPVEIDPRGPLPVGNLHYDVIRDLPDTGFEFTPRELMHAIGSKTATLPMSALDESFKSAYFLLYQIDFSSVPVRLNPQIDQDYKAFRSQQLGIGITCLFAYRYFGIPWDQLEQIAGTASRFDYRGSANGTQCIFESKGTMNRRDQSQQILSGLEKKAAHHDRGEHFDVELVLSTHLGDGQSSPRLLLADPKRESYETAFGPGLDRVYTLRHFSRVLQYLGDTSAARTYYVRSMDLLRSREEIPSPTVRGPAPKLQAILANGDTFVGRWFGSAVPERLTPRYSRKSSGMELLKAKGDTEIFQGLRQDHYDLLRTGSDIQIKMLPEEAYSAYETSDDGHRVSVFPDGTVMAFRARR